MLLSRARTAEAIVVGAIAMIALASTGYYAGKTKEQEQRAARMTRGDAENASAILVQYGCAGCHSIPGIAAPGGLAGPQLSGLSKRLYIGGAVQHTPEGLIGFIVNPKQFSSQSAMPVTGISEREARDVAAYLYTR